MKHAARIRKAESAVMPKAPIANALWFEETAGSWFEYEYHLGAPELNRRIPITHEAMIEKCAAVPPGHPQPFRISEDSEDRKAVTV